jgi:hypothetical protein
MDDDTGTSGDVTRAELFVRSLAGGPVYGIQQEVYERLDALATTGGLDEFTLHVWGGELARDASTARCETGRFVANRIAAFQRWATENGLDLPSVETTEVRSTITGDEYPVTRLPRLALAEFREGSLHHVAPCAGRDGHTAVVDRVAALEADLGRADDAEALAGGTDGSADDRTGEASPRRRLDAAPVDRHR